MYEAGPFGYTLHDRLVERGVDSLVCSPGLVPVQVGNRVKADRRDSRELATMLEVGLSWPQASVPDRSVPERGCSSGLVCSYGCGQEGRRSDPVRGIAEMSPRERQPGVARPHHGKVERAEFAVPSDAAAGAKAGETDDRFAAIAHRRGEEDRRLPASLQEPSLPACFKLEHGRVEDDVERHAPDVRCSHDLDSNRQRVPHRDLDGGRHHAHLGGRESLLSPTVT